MKKRAPVNPTDSVEPHILTLRGQKVIVDADLAAIYGVTTKRLNEQVKRNQKRFPADFMFQLTRAEFAIIRSQFATTSAQPTEQEQPENLRSQIATSSFGYGGPRYLPHAFTETGAIMAANVLNSPEAVRMSVMVVRAFIQMRALIVDHKALANKLAELDARVGNHDEQLAAIIQAIRQLASPDGPMHGRKIGFNR